MIRLPNFGNRVPKKISDAVKVIEYAGPEASFLSRRAGATTRRGAFVRA